jgi:alkyl sulfatase BDS1-like metallo-beta-lactamase superfamily hydrolase
VTEHSTDTIVLEADEKETLVAAARRHTSPYCDVMRARAILLAADGLTDRQISDRLELPRSLVDKWRKHFFTRRRSRLREVRESGDG